MNRLLKLGEENMAVQASDLTEATLLLGGGTHSTPVAPEPNENLLARAIFERCVTEVVLVDKYRCLRKIALTTSILTSLSAGAGFFPISLSLPAGFLFAAANFIGFFKLDIWAIRGTVGDLLGPRSEKEIALLSRSSSSKCFQVAVVVASAVIALLSQVPVALPALDYDGKLGLPATVCLFVGGALLPIRSLQLSISKTIQLWKNNSKDTKSIEILRERMGSMIEKRQELLRKSDRMSQSEQVRHFKTFEGSDVERTSQFIEAAIQPPIEAPTTARTALSRRIARIVGLWIAGSLQTGLAIYTFEKTKEHILNNNTFAGALAGSVVLSGVYLSGKSILDTSERLTVASLNTIRGQPEKTLAEQLRPKTTLALKLLGLTIDLGALGATTVIWGDFYKNNLPLKVYFTSTLCLAYFLFLSTSTSDMINEVVEEFIHHKGTEEERNTIKLNSKLRKTQKLIEDSHVTDLEIFIKHFPNHLKIKLAERTGIEIKT